MPKPKRRRRRDDDERDTPRETRAANAEVFAVMKWGAAAAAGLCCGFPFVTDVTPLLRHVWIELGIVFALAACFCQAEEHHFS